MAEETKSAVETALQPEHLHSNQPLSAGCGVSLVMAVVVVVPKHDLD